MQRGEMLMTILSCRFCEQQNPAGAKYCNECGSPLGLRPCSQCEAINSLDAELCYQCGLVLDARVAREPALPTIREHAAHVESTHCELIGADAAVGSSAIDGAVRGDEHLTVPASLGRRFDEDDLCPAHPDSVEPFVAPTFKSNTDPAPTE